MKELWQSIIDWFFSLGNKYGVNPIVFGSIYLGAIPFFTICVAWIIRNIRQKKSIVLPTILAGLFIISAYLYLIIAGKNIPFWVYGIIIILVLYAAYSTIKKIRKKTK